MKRRQAVIFKQALLRPLTVSGTANPESQTGLPSTDELSRVDHAVVAKVVAKVEMIGGGICGDVKCDVSVLKQQPPLTAVVDHVSAVVFDQTGTVEQVTHYYPFGGVMRESTNPAVQPYKYGGKELDRTSGLDTYDFGARMYFADRMQWGQMDPLCEKYYDWSPYNYCFNSPANKIDPEGEIPISAIIEGIGSFMISAGVSFLENWLLEEKDFDTAFLDINWGAAAFDAISTATLSLFVDGTGMAKTISKFESSKMGRLAINVMQNMTTSIISQIEDGDKLNKDFFVNSFISATVSALVSQNMGEKASELLGQLKTNNTKLYNSI